MKLSLRKNFLLFQSTCVTACDVSENAPNENKTQWFFFGGFLRIVDTSSTTIITGFQKAGRCLLKLSKVSCSTLGLQKYERHSAITTATQK